MARQPEFLQVDTLGELLCRTPEPAQVDLLTQASAAQHAMMSGFAGPMLSHSIYLRAGGGGPTNPSTKIPVRVPPGVTRARMAVCARGRGDVAFSTPVEAGDTVFTYISIGGPGLSNINPRWTWGSASGGTGIQNRTLRLFATSAETWRTLFIDVGLSASDAEVFGLAIVPVHPAR
jgi:hypothetical protein